MAKIAPRSARLTVEEAVYEFGEARSTIQRALIRAGKAPGRIGAALGRVIDHSKLEAREKADLNQDLLQLSAHRPVSASTGPSKRKRKRRKRTLG